MAGSLESKHNFFYLWYTFNVPALYIVIIARYRVVFLLRKSNSSNSIIVSEWVNWSWVSSKREVFLKRVFPERNQTCKGSIYDPGIKPSSPPLYPSHQSISFYCSLSRIKTASVGNCSKHGWKKKWFCLHEIDFSIPLLFFVFVVMLHDGRNRQEWNEKV